MSNSTQDQWNAVADRFWAALDQGNMHQVMDCCHPSVTSWHNFDQKFLDFAATKTGLSAFVEGSTERATTDVHRDYFLDGFVQQHILEVRFQPGAPKRAWTVCVLMRFKDGKIVAITEYIDRAGSFEPRKV